MEVVERLLQVDGLDVNQARTDIGVSPLYIACDLGNVEVVERLLEVDGLDLNQPRTSDGATPLSVACKNGHVEVVKLCVAQCARDAWQPQAMVSALQAAVDSAMDTHALRCFHCVFTANAEALCASTLLRDKVRTWPEPFASVVHQELRWRRRRPMLAIARLLRIERGSVCTGAGIKGRGPHVGRCATLQRCDTSSSVGVGSGVVPNERVRVVQTCSTWTNEAARARNDVVPQCHGRVSDPTAATSPPSSPSIARCPTPTVVSRSAHTNVVQQVTLRALEACLSGDGEQLRQLVDAVELRRRWGTTWLWVAASEGHLGVVTELLRAGVGVNEPPCLDFASGVLHSVQLDAYFSERPLDSARFTGGATVLYIACAHGRSSVVERLLQVDGLDVNQGRTDHNTTHLYVACQNGYVDVVERLLQWIGWM